MPGIALRPFAAADADAVRALLSDTLMATWWPHLSEAARAAHAGNDRIAAYVAGMAPEFLLATYEGEIAGMAHWRGNFLNALHVRPDRQRRGIGAVLLASAERAMAEAGETAARLETDTFNTQSRRFYEKHGYAEIDRYPDTEWNSGFTTILFEKAL